MADLQHRLDEVGLPCPPDADGLFGAGTAAAVEAFQHRRGLRVDGVCGRQTWGALVEAGFRLGDRFLYLHAPMFRGDDVADLQQRLSALGFDTGRVDGIFGGLTSSALADFQRNVSLPVDGILGASTLRELKRVMPRHAEPELVSSVRDRERLRQAPRTLLGPASGHRRGGRPRRPRHRRTPPPGGHRGRGRPPAAPRRVAAGGGGQRRSGRGLHRSAARPRPDPVLGVLLRAATATSRPGAVAWPNCCSRWRPPPSGSRPTASGACPCPSCVKHACRR